MVGKEISFNSPLSRRKVSNACAASISVSLPFAACGVEPAKETRHGDAVAQMRGAGAGKFDRVLRRLHQGDGIAARAELAAGVGKGVDQRRGRGRRVILQGVSAFAPSWVEPSVQVGGRRRVRPVRRGFAKSSAKACADR